MKTEPCRCCMPNDSVMLQGACAQYMTTTILKLHRSYLKPASNRNHKNNNSKENAPRLCSTDIWMLQQLLLYKWWTAHCACTFFCTWGQIMPTQLTAMTCTEENSHKQAATLDDHSTRCEVLQQEVMPKSLGIRHESHTCWDANWNQTQQNQLVLEIM